MKQSFNLTSIGLKIVSMLLLLALTSLTIVFIIFRSQIPWYGIMISTTLMLILLLINFILFFNRIVVDSDKKTIIIQNLKYKKINFDNILTVEVDKSNSINPDKYCFIVFRLSSNAFFKISGFSSIGKNKVKTTENIVSRINKALNK